MSAEAEADTSESELDVSLLIPVFNERDNLRPLWEEVARTLDELAPLRCEVVFTDDGSSDGSAEVLAELAAAEPERIRVIVLSRNFGQTAAIDAAMRRARGRVLVALDADQQNDPADIPAILAEVAAGADVVSGWRRDRKDAFLHRRLPSQLANWLIARMTGVRIHDFGCTLKAYRREALAGVRLYGEMHRFIPAFAAWNGARVVERVVNHRPRTRGRSKYGLWRTVKVVLDLLTVLFLQRGYASRPLHVFGGFGLLLMLGAMGLAGYTLYLKSLFPVGDPQHMYVHRNPLAALAAIVLILGAGAVALGLLAELLARIYHATASSSYRIVGGHNLAELPTPQEARSLGPRLDALVSPPSAPATAPAPAPPD